MRLLVERLQVVGAVAARVAGPHPAVEHLQAGRVRAAVEQRALAARHPHPRADCLQAGKDAIYYILYSTSNFNELYL